ncbi:MAG: arginine deiminase family protein [Halanaeroarchaeum sp.]
MTEYTARAEFDPLTAVRVHEPGLEVWSGALAPESNLFEAPVAPEQARREHRRYVEVLEANGVTVHTLADDLDGAGVLDEMVREYADLPDVDRAIDHLDAGERLELVLSRAHLTANDDAPDSVHVDRPISNVYFQRDTTILGDRGPVLCDMHSPVRRPEVSIVRAAWEGIGADPVFEAPTGPIEGGEFIPAGEFALLGVSGVVDGEEVVVRTSYEAGEDLLASGAFGYDQVGLVRTPVEADRRLREQHGGPSRLMHLLGWFNIAAEGLAVTFPELASAATVEVFDRRGEHYEHARSTTLATYLAEKGYDVVAADRSDRWPTNFVATDDGVVVALYDPDDGGEYRPENNPTIERLKERGVTVLPDGEGLPTGALTNGAGGLHCMTTPVSRG